MEEMEDLNSYFKPGSIFRSDTIQNDYNEENEHETEKMKCSNSDANFMEVNLEPRKRDEDSVFIDNYFSRGSECRSKYSFSKPKVQNEEPTMDLPKREAISFSFDGECKSTFCRNKSERDSKQCKVFASKINVTHRCRDSEHDGSRSKASENNHSIKGHVSSNIGATQFDDCNIDSYFDEGSIFRLSGGTSSLNSEEQHRISDKQINVEKNCQYNNNAKQTTKSNIDKKYERNSKTKFTKRTSFSAEDLSDLKKNSNICDMQFDDCNINAKQINVEEHCHYNNNSKQTTKTNIYKKFAQNHKSLKTKLIKTSSFSADDIPDLTKSTHYEDKCKRSILDKIVSKLHSKCRIGDKEQRSPSVLYKAQNAADICVLGSSPNLPNLTSDYVCKTPDYLKSSCAGNGGIYNSKHKSFETKDTFIDRYFTLEHTFNCIGVNKSVRSFSCVINGNCWVSFQTFNKIQRYDRYGSIEDELSVDGNVDDITSDQAGNLFISLTKKRQILVYNVNKEIKCFISFWKIYPRGIANRSSENSLVVCCNLLDVGHAGNICSNDKVKMFSKKSEHPKGEYVTHSDCFAYPVRVCVNRNDDVIVTDFDKRRIVSISPQNRVKFSFSGCTEFSFDEAIPSITCDSMSNIFIIDKRGKVCMLDSDGNLKDSLELPMHGNGCIKACLLDFNGYLWTGSIDGKISIYKYTTI